MSNIIFNYCDNRTNKSYTNTNLDDLLAEIADITYTTLSDNVITIWVYSQPNNIHKPPVTLDMYKEVITNKIKEASSYLDLVEVFTGFCIYVAKHDYKIIGCCGLWENNDRWLTVKTIPEWFEKEYSPIPKGTIVNVKGIDGEFIVVDVPCMKESIITYNDIKTTYELEGIRRCNDGSTMRLYMSRPLYNITESDLVVSPNQNTSKLTEPILYDIRRKLYEAELGPRINK